MATAAALGWSVLALQLYLSLTLATANGIGLIAGLITYISFFTILTNILVATIFTLPWVRPDRRWSTLLMSPAAQSGVAVYITIVGLGYSLLLRHVWHPEGLQKVADVILHDVMPVAYVAYWLAFVPKGSLRWKDTAAWLLYPAAYFLYVLLRGAVSNRYPYPFVDVTTYGYQRVLVNSVMLLVALVGVGLLFIAIDHAMKSSSR